MEQKKQKIGYIIFMFAVYLWSVFLFAACQKQPTWQEQYDLGMRYLSESNYEEAIMAFTAAIEIEPNNADAYFQLSDAYMTINQPEEAGEILVQCYQATEDKTLEQAVSLCDIGIYYFGRMDYEKAIQVFEVSIAVEPDQADAYYYLGSIYAIEGDQERARQIFLDGYKATGDDRMNPDMFSVNSYYWEDYNKNVPLNERGNYIAFEQFSPDNQDQIRQFVEVLETNDNETLKSLLVASHDLPYQFCTEIDGYKIAAVIAKSNEVAAGFTALDHSMGWLTKKNLDPFTIQLVLSIEIRPENGQGFSYFYVESHSEEGDEPVVFRSSESYCTVECQNWQYNGEWNRSINDSMTHSYSYANSNTGERIFHAVREESGVAVDNTTTREHGTTVSSTEEYLNGRLLNSQESDELLWETPEPDMAVHEHW